MSYGKPKFEKISEKANPLFQNKKIHCGVYGGSICHHAVGTLVKFVA